PDPPTSHLYTLSLHDALPISIIATSSITAASPQQRRLANLKLGMLMEAFSAPAALMAAYWAQSISEPTLRKVFAFSAIGIAIIRSEEHTSELQSRENLVCRLL